MSGVNGPRGSFRLQRQQCVDETNNTVSPDIVTSDQVTSDHVRRAVASHQIRG